MWEGLVLRPGEAVLQQMFPDGLVGTVGLCPADLALEWDVLVLSVWHSRDAQYCGN